MSFSKKKFPHSEIKKILMPQSALGHKNGVAVAVSGGPDSMCLAHFLATYREELGIKRIHALIVDHGLRPESGSEAARVRETLSAIQGLEPFILTVKIPIGETGIQEKARKERYRLLFSYCRDKGIELLVTGHHLNDQAETVLFRLAKGSGLDGLCGMKQYVEIEKGLKLGRPLLDVPKEMLIEYCHDCDIVYVQDPTNELSRFARVRLRKSQAVLQQEGMTAHRLSVTANRLQRAREALEYYADKAFEQAKIEVLPEMRYVFSFRFLAGLPTETRIRILSRILKEMDPESDYGPRVKRVEALESALFSEKTFKRRTLGKAAVSRDKKADHIFFENISAVSPK